MRDRDPSYNSGHVPNALLLNEQEADALMVDLFGVLQDNTLPVVVYCGSESCHASKEMAEYLQRRLPTESVYVLRGGWEAWSKKYGKGI